VKFGDQGWKFGAENPVGLGQNLLGKIDLDDTGLA
jgi:hypothetical protein